MKVDPLKAPVDGPVRQIPRGGPSNTMEYSGRSDKYHGPQISFQIKGKIGEPRFPPAVPSWKEEENGTSREASSVLRILFLLKEIATTEKKIIPNTREPLVDYMIVFCLPRRSHVLCC